MLLNSITQSIKFEQFPAQVQCLDYLKWWFCELQNAILTGHYTRNPGMERSRGTKEKMP